MCLKLTENSRLRVAEEDIVCYKMLYTRDCIGDIKSDVFLLTPFWQMRVELGKEYDSNLVSRYSNEVNEGFHTFQDKDKAVSYCKSYNKYKKEVNRPQRYSVMKCIIPKGSRYYDGLYESGVFSCFYFSFASDKIRYTDEFVYFWEDDEDIKEK